MEQQIDISLSDQMQTEELYAEQQRLLARYGAATIELKSVRGLLSPIPDRQRQLVRDIAARCGITRYVSARIEGRKLICQMLDEAQFVDAKPPEPPQRIDGLTKTP